MLTKSDFSLIFAVIALILGSYFLFDLSRDIERYVVIYVDGNEINKIKLPQNIKFDFNGKEGPIKLEINGRKARVLDSSCPNKVCVNSGWINKNGESIICLPNRATIKILGEEKELDGITK